MRTISIRLDDLKKTRIHIGYVGENEHTQVRIDSKEMFKEYPTAEVSMALASPAGSYPKTVTRDGDTVVWDVKNSDLVAEGDGELQLSFTANGVIAKSYRGQYTIMRSVAGDGEAPDPIQDWMTEASEALEDLEAAEVHQPIIDDNGYWNTWDQETGEYVATETKAQGEDGDPGQPGQDGQDGTDATPDLITKDYADLTFPVAKDSFCYHDGKLYQANQAIQTSEQWTAAHWTETTVEEQLTTVKSALHGKADIILAKETGNPVNMSDSKSGELVNALVIDLPPVQLGTGTPSPTNPRQFAPWTGLNVYHGANQTTYDTYTFTWENGSSIYGGTLNALTGVFTVEWVAETANSNNWSVAANGNAYQFGHTPCKWGSVGTHIYQKCTHWENTVYYNDGSVVLNHNGALYIGYKYWQAAGITPTTESVAQYFADQALAGTPLYVCAALKEPYTIQLTPITIETLSGSEIIWANNNAILNIDYFADTKKYIDRPAMEQQRILVFGDSIWGADRTDGIADFLKEYSGATIFNCAIGGTIICGDRSSSDAYTPFDGVNFIHAKVTNTWTNQDAKASQVVAYVASDVLPMLKALDLSTIDIVILAYGTNDFAKARTVEAIKTAYETVISELLTAYPALRIIAIAPPWRTLNNGTWDADTFINNKSESLKDVANGIVEGANAHHITALNMWNELPWRAETAWYYMDTDKVHPNTEGNKIYAHVVHGKLKSMF